MRRSVRILGFSHPEFFLAPGNSNTKAVVPFA
jgi:hypothetical protein